MSELCFFRFVGLPPEGRRLHNSRAPFPQLVDDIAVPNCGDDTENCRIATDIWHIIHPGALMLARTQLP